MLDLDEAWKDAAAVLLLLHGGKVDSHEPVTRVNLAAARMKLMARALRRGTALPAVTLRYRVRGWNDADGARTPDPVRDALTALDTIQGELGPVPVILVGHSMGGRTAVRVAWYPTVRAVAALAPWLPPDEPVDTLVGRRLMIAHGRRDRITDPARSIAYAARADAVAESVDLERLDDGHAMLRQPAVWNRLVTEFIQQAVSGL